MKLELNARGNGACPLCSSVGNCQIRKNLAIGVEGCLADASMELVIYSCPYFSERAGS
jgi:hypothetical protein